MTKKKKCILAAIIIMIIAIIGLGYLYFNFKKEEKKLKTGIYFLHSYGALYYESQEDISFNLLLYFYNSEDENDYDLLRQYSDFELITNTGSNIHFEIDGYIDSFLKADDNRMFQNSIKIDISESYLRDNELNITGLSYKDENGKIKKVSLGNILIKKVEKTQSVAEVVAIKFEWKRFSLPVMNTYDIRVGNLGENSITIKNIDFGFKEMSSDFGNMELGANEIFEYNCEVDFSDISGDVIFYLKPLIKIDNNGEEGWIVQKNICRHRYISSDKSLYDYFLDGGKDE